MSPDASFVSNIRLSNTEQESPILQPDTPSVTNASYPSALKHLISSDQKQLFDALDKLGACGLPDDLSLPQLVVCGDQSSGKSSVLEALTEIDFPREDNRACTRFATQISLRRARKESLAVTINPHKDRTAEEKKTLRSFDYRIESLHQLNAELGQVIERAKLAMGISNEPSEFGNNGFSKDILNIEVSGPGREHLTLVDLPGLFQNDSGRGEGQVVEAITKSYIGEARTICLPVINAANDVANQGIVKIVKMADKDGHRTMGIVTKPDRAEQASNQSSFYVRLVRNDAEHYKLAQGWHVLRNRSPGQQQISFTERNESETRFFETSIFRSIQPEHRGIVALRRRLGDMLFQHAQKELPQVRIEIMKLIMGARSNLERLGPERIEPSQCRKYLVAVASKSHLLGRNADEGIYKGSFFAEQSESFYNRPPWAVRRLRATIMDCYKDFRTIMLERGHTFQLLGDLRMPPMAPFKSKPSPQKQTSTRVPALMSQIYMVDRVSKKIVGSRGQELQGDSNPFVVKDLFKEQSQHWEALAQEHVDDVSRICESFMLDVLDETCAADVRANIRVRHLQRAMAKRKEAAQRALKAVIRVMREHPVDYSTDYRHHLEVVRSRRLGTEKSADQTDEAKQSEQNASTGTTQPSQESGRLFSLSTPPQATEKARSPSGKAQLKAPRSSSLFGRSDQPAQTLGPHSDTTTTPQTGSGLFNIMTQTPSVFSDVPQVATAEYHETIDRVLALYETKRTTFIDMVNSLVVEDNLVRDLAQVLSPDRWAAALSDEEVLKFARETDAVHNQRRHLQQQLAGLEEGQRIIDSLSMSV